MRHSANLDILRTLAVSTVLIDHLAPTMAVHAGFHNLAILAFVDHIGHAGVLAFFVHTSLVLMYSLERMTSSTERVTLRFYIRRFFRIYPLAVFCILLALVLHIPNVTWQQPDAISKAVIVSNLLLVQDIFARVNILSPLWSLPFEVQMYLFLPALYFLTLKRHAVRYVAGLFAFFCGFGVLVYVVTGGHLSLAEFIPCFLCGVLCYTLRDRLRATIPWALWPMFVILLISSYCLFRERYDGRHPMSSFWIGWVFCLLLGLAINAFQNSSGSVINLAAEKIALYSYGIYLVHIPILYLVFIVFGVKSMVLGPLLFLALTMAASIAAYHCIEAPFIELGKRLSSNPAVDPALAAATPVQHAP